MMTITYPVKRGIYVNMTNRCPCACTFCLRQHGDSVYGSDPLWLDREPTVDEVCESLDAWDLSQYEEIVFCGYGLCFNGAIVNIDAAIRSVHARHGSFGIDNSNIVSCR